MFGSEATLLSLILMSLSYYGGLNGTQTDSFIKSFVTHEEKLVKIANVRLLYIIQVASNFTSLKFQQYDL